MNEENKGRIDRLNESLYSRTSKISQKERTTLSPREENSLEAELNSDGVSLDEIVSLDPPSKHYSHLMQKIFLGSIIFFVFAVAFAGLMIFRGGGSVSSKNIDISLVGPTTVAGGSPVDFKLNIVNKNNVSLDNVNLKIEYPNSARNVEDRNKPLALENVDLGTLSPGKDVVKDLPMVIYAERGVVEKLIVSLEYRVSGSNSVFIAKKEFEIAVGFTPLVTTISYPNNINSGDEVSFVVEVSSNSTDTIYNVLLVAEYPFGFVYTNGSPSPYTDDNVWRLGDIPSGEKKTITIKGRLEAQDEEERTFRFNTGVTDSSNDRDIQSVLVSSLETIKVSRPFLNLSSKINGEGQSVYLAKPGERIVVSIDWKNNLPQPALNALVEVKINGSFDRGSVVPRSGGFFRSSDNTVVWQGSGLSSLREIAPGESGSVDFSITLPPTFSSSGNNETTFDISIKANTVEEGGGSSRPIEAKITKIARLSSLPTLNVSSGRSSGVIENSGPVPPKVDQETTYSIFLSLRNSGSDLNRVEVRGILPPYVSFKSVTTPTNERVSFNSNTREILWNVGSVPASTGSSLPERKVEFQVGLIPSLSQLSSTPILIENIELSGFDVLNGGNIYVSGNDATTRTQDSSFRDGQERVVE